MFNLTTAVALSDLTLPTFYHIDMKIKVGIFNSYSYMQNSNNAIFVVVCTSYFLFVFACVYGDCGHAWTKHCPENMVRLGCM